MSNSTTHAFMHSALLLAFVLWMDEWTQAITLRAGKGWKLGDVSLQSGRCPLKTYWLIIGSFQVREAPKEGVGSS